MRLQLLGVGSVPVLTVPLKDDDDSCITSQRWRVFWA